MTISEGEEVILDPQAGLKYSWDWSLWLANRNNDTIVSATVVGYGGIVAGAATFDATSVTSRLTYADAPGTARATCHIVTATGEEDDRTIPFKVQNR